MVSTAQLLYSASLSRCGAAPIAKTPMTRVLAWFTPDRSGWETPWCTSHTTLFVAILLHAVLLIFLWQNQPSIVTSSESILSVSLIPSEAPPEPEVEPEPPKPKPEPLPKPIKKPTPLAVPKTAPTETASEVEAPAEITPPQEVKESRPTEGPISQPQFDAAYLNNPKPHYPPLSRRLNEQGTVMLRVHVLANGRAGEIQLQKSSGFERLDSSARQAVQRWSFVPAQRGGRAVDAWVIVPVSFSLSQK